MYLIYVAATVSFIQLPYTINEDDGVVQTLLIFSNEVSYTVTFDVILVNGTTDGEQYIECLLTTLLFFNRAGL